MNKLFDDLVRFSCGQKLYLPISGVVDTYHTVTDFIEYCKNRKGVVEAAIKDNAYDLGYCSHLKGVLVDAPLKIDSVQGSPETIEAELLMGKPILFKVLNFEPNTMELLEEHMNILTDEKANSTQQLAAVFIYTGLILAKEQLIKGIRQDVAKRPLLENIYQWAKDKTVDLEQKDLAYYVDLVADAPKGKHSAKPTSWEALDSETLLVDKVNNYLTEQFLTGDTKSTLSFTLSKFGKSAFAAFAAYLFLKQQAKEGNGKLLTQFSSVDKLRAAIVRNLKTELFSNKKELEEIKGDLGQKFNFSYYNSLIGLTIADDLTVRIPVFTEGFGTVCGNTGNALTAIKELESYYLLEPSTLKIDWCFPTKAEMDSNQYLINDFIETISTHSIPAHIEKAREYGYLNTPEKLGLDSVDIFGSGAK